MSGQVKITPSSDGRPTLHVAVTDARPYKREATRVDAFLYANARIGGKLGNRGGHINGGLIARQIGILAPGKGEHNDHFTNLLRREDREGFRSCAPGTADSTEDMHVMADGACAYSINYDHRLRNGGYGFNLIRGVMGGTTEWRLDPTGESAVRR